MNKLIPIFNNARAQKIFIVIFIIIAIALLIQTYNKAYRDIGYDFSSYLLSAKALLHGENPYHTDTPFPYLYPMFLAFLLIPLSVLPYWLSNFLWFVINFFALILSVHLILKMAALHKGFTQYIVPLVVLFILFFGVIQNNLLNGQVNFLVLFFCVLFLKFHQEDKNAWSAFFLAAAISIKIVPVVLLLFLIFRRRFGTVILTILFSAVLLVSPIIFLGREIFGIYGEYVNEFLAGGLFGTVGPYHSGMFFTLHGFISYLFPALTEFYWIKVISALIVLLPLLGLELAFLSRSTAKNHLPVMQNSAFFCLYLITILLISPMSEKHHLIFLFPALSIIWLAWPFEMGSFLSKQSLFIYLFFVFFFFGQGFKYGPFYFFAIVILYFLVWGTIKKGLSTVLYNQPFSAEKIP